MYDEKWTEECEAEPDEWPEGVEEAVFAVVEKDAYVGEDGDEEARRYVSFDLNKGESAKSLTTFL